MKVEFRFGTSRIASHNAPSTSRMAVPAGNPVRLVIPLASFRYGQGAVLALPAPSEEHLRQQDQKEEERQTIAQPESGRYQRSVEIHALAPPFKSRQKSMRT